MFSYSLFLIWASIQSLKCLVLNSSDGFVLGAEIGALLKWEAIQRSRVAEVEESMFCHLRIVEHAVEDLRLGQAAFFVLLQPGMALDQFLMDLVGHVVVALAEYVDEVGAAEVDLR